MAFFLTFLILATIVLPVIKVSEAGRLIGLALLIEVVGSNGSAG